MCSSLRSEKLLKVISMNVIAPPEEKSIKQLSTTDKKFLAKALVSELRAIETLADGRRLTKGQMLAERLINIACYAPSNTEAIMASKLIFDRIEGRAAVLENKEVKDMPKVVFALREEELSQVAKKAESENDSVLVKTDSGEEYIV